MADHWQQRRPRLAYPFTILTETDTVRLIAGEDFRYTLTAPQLDQWLPALLNRLRGQQTLQAIFADLDPARRDSAWQLLRHLYGERVLVDGGAADAHCQRRYRVVVEGNRDLLALPVEVATSESAAPLVVLCQDRLDYEEALLCGRRCRSEQTPMLWVSHGAMTRAYVSPLFLPDVGPCFGCLLQSFRRLSPAPEIHDALREHARSGRPIAPVDFPAEGLLILQGLVRWKLQQAGLEHPDPALYRLHVLEREHFEVATHRVFVDPFCPECGKERPP